MPLSDIIGMFGSDKPPKAVLNRYAAPVQAADRRLATSTLNSLYPATQSAFDTYMAGQGKQEELAGDQEGMLRELLARRMGNDPLQSLKDIYQTSFAQIDPNVVAPLARFDVNSNMLANRARGISPAALDSTAERLRNSRVASGRYYDVARQVYGVVPQLFNSAYAQGLSNDQAAAGYIPQISAGYEAVANRPTQGILNRINTVRQGQGISSQGIANAIGATQGYQEQKNWADKFSKALKADEQTVMQIAQMALSAYTGGLAGGGGGGGIMSMLGGMGGGGGGQPSGTPAYGSQYPGYGGMYQSMPNAQGGGYSAPLG